MNEYSGPTIAILANRGFAISNSRIPLVLRMRDAGWKVLLMTADDRDARTIESLGVQRETVDFYRGGLSVTRDIRTLVRLIRLFSRYRPVLIHLFHAKPILLGSVAISAIPGWQPKIVSTITGLGYSYQSRGANWLLASAGYRRLMKRCDATIFQNQDDRRIFIERGWIREDRAVLIGSSGVDTARFRPAKEHGAMKTVLMLSRLIRQKGVQDYLDAARMLRERHADTTFLLAGEIETEHADRIEEAEILRATQESGVRYLGFVADVEKLLARTDILVFPSYYREGVPRVVIEAAACAVPVVGADVPGTRDAVVDGVTGLLVSPRDPAALAERIGQLLNDDDWRWRLGRAALQKALTDFDVNQITDRQLAVYRSILPAAWKNSIGG